MYAMKYRAGISPKRTNPKRKSEYDYKYGWKMPVDSAPLLTAEQVHLLDNTHCMLFYRFYAFTGFLLFRLNILPQICV